MACACRHRVVASYDVVLEEGLLSKEELDEILLPENMIKPKKFQRKQVQ